MNELFNSPIRLSKAEQENPLQVLSEFTCDYDLRDIRQHLWQLVVLALTSPDEAFDEPGARTDLMYFYERTEQLIEAAFVIAGKASGGKTSLAVPE